jgi:hypothetical protein
VHGLTFLSEYAFPDSALSTPATHCCDVFNNEEARGISSELQFLEAPQTTNWRRRLRNEFAAPLQF